MHFFLVVFLVLSVVTLNRLVSICRQNSPTHNISLGYSLNLPPISLCVHIAAADVMYQENTVHCGILWNPCRQDPEIDVLVSNIICKKVRREHLIATELKILSGNHNLDRNVYSSFFADWLVS